MKKLMLVLLVIACAVFFGIRSVDAKKDEIKLRVFVHSPGKPIITSSCAATIDDQVNDYGLTGWHMPTGGMDFQINYSSVPRNLVGTNFAIAIDNSFATWHSADSKQTFVDSGSTLAKNAKLDGTNAVLFKKINRQAIAITYVWYYSSGELAEADTIFNSGYKWSINNPALGDCISSLTYDVQNIATHEFGHWVGLDDLYDSADKDLTMYGYGDLGELKATSLGLGDITGANTVVP